MTGQLFVVPQGGPDGSVRPARARARGRPRDPVPGHPQVRADRAVRRPDDAPTRSRRSGPEPLVRRVHGRRRSGAGSGRARAGSSRSCSTRRSSPASATSTPTRRSGRPASIRSGPPGRSARPTSAGSGRELRRILAEAVIRRGSSIDDYTAPDGDGEMQEHLAVYQRTGEPCLRCGRPIRRIVVGGRATHFCSWCQRLPAADRAGARRDPRGRCRRRERRGRRWTELPGGEGSVGPDADADRDGRASRGPSGPGGRPRPAGRPRAPRSGAEPVSILRLDRRPSRGRDVRHPRRRSRPRSRSATGSGSSGRTAPARRRCSGSRPGVDEPDGGEVHRKRGLTHRAARPGVALRRGVHGRAGPPGRGPRGARRTSTTMAAELAALERERPGRGAGLRRPPARVRRPRRLHARPARRRGAVRPRLRRATSGPGRRPRCPAASRPGRRSPGSSSPTRTCCCSTSRRTTSTSARSSGSRSTSGGAAASLLVASHDRAFLDATVTRIWELRDRRLTAFRGDYSAYHRQREERDARAAKDADSQAEPIERERELVQRYRSHRKFTQDARARGPARAAPGRAGRGAEGGRKLRLPGGRAGRRRAGAVGRDRRPGRGPRRRLPARPRRGRRRRRARQRSRGRVATVPFLAAQRGDRIGIVGPNGAGKTTLLRTIAGDLPPLDGALTFGNAVQLGLSRPAARRGDPGRDGARRAARGDPGDARRGARLPRPVPVPRRRRVQGGPARCRAGSGRGSSSRCSGSCRRTCSCSTSRRTTSTSRPARRSSRSCSTRRRRCSSSRHDRRLLETVCTTPVGRRRRAGRARSTAADREWRAAVADGWTVSGREAAARSGGAHGGRGVARRRGRGPAGRGGRAGPAATRRRRRAGRPQRAVRRARRPAPPREAVEGRLPPPARPSLDAELTRLGLRKSHLELAMGDPAVAANFVEMRRVTSELADVERGARGRRGRLARARGAGAVTTFRIGLTGPIGCGKSTVAGWLAERGARRRSTPTTSPAR